MIYALISWFLIMHLNVRQEAKAYSKLCQTKNIRELSISGLVDYLPALQVLECWGFMFF